MAIDFNSTLKKLADGVVGSASSLTDETVKLANRAFDKHICIGVTGFSGSGKSTFITSLIHQLRYSNEAKLGGFLPARDLKIVDVKLLAINGLDLFDYQAGIHALASDPPQWPDPTSHLSGCIIEITYKRDSLFNSILGDTSKLQIEIRDYPGEWLLDIPLLEQDYLSWCCDMTELMMQTQRRDLMGELFNQLQSLKPLDKLSELEIDKLGQLYSAFLIRCKEQGMTLVQPGHMLLSGQHDNFKPFIPLLNLHHYDKKALMQAEAGSVYRVMEQRYIDYVKETVKPFYNDYFKSIDRQVILIDTLKALSGGRANFDDMMIAFTRIIDSYRVGLTGFIKKLVFPKVERIVFLSSKPDRVLSNQHENLRQLTNSIINRICTQSIRNTISIETEIACAVRCTQDHESYLKVIRSDGKQGHLNHPIIPEHIPVDDEWDAFKHWTLPDIRPPAIPNLKHGARLPSIRIDMVLKDLIGDKF